MISGRVTRRRAAQLVREQELEAHLAALTGPRFPNELIDIIIGHALADLWGDLVLAPENLREWEAGSVLLQVSRTFRACTIKYMEPLWGGGFPVGKRTYKQTMALCRRYSEYARWWPHDFIAGRKTPTGLKHSILEKLRVPMVILLKKIITGVAHSLCDRNDPRRDKKLYPHMMDGLIAFAAEYGKLSHRTRSVLFTRVEQYLEEEYVPRIRICMLRGAIGMLFSLLEDTMDALILVPDANYISRCPDKILAASQTFNSTLWCLCEEHLVSCNGHERDIVLARYDFPFSMWTKVMDMMARVEKFSQTTADACQLWKQTYATLMSEGDRRRYLPNVSLATPPQVTQNEGTVPTHP